MKDEYKDYRLRQAKGMANMAADFFKAKNPIDDTAFDQQIFEQCILRGWRDRLWACWKMLKGDVSAIVFHVPANKWRKP